MVLNKKFWLKMKAGTTPSSTEIDNDFWKYFKPGDKMLDVGCGWGRAVKECLKRGIYAVGIDINKNEIKALKAQNLNGAEIKYGDILKIKFKDKFNGVMMLGVLCTMEKEERQACLKKVNSILIEKGHVFISEFETSDKFKKRYEDDFKITKEYGTLSVKDAGREVFRSHNFTKEEICDLLNSSGFKIVKFKRAEFTSYHRDKKPGMMITAQKI